MPETDLTRILQAVWRRRWLVLALAVAGLAVAAALTQRMPRQYAARTSLVLDPAPPFLDGHVQDVVKEQASGYWASDEYLATEQQIILSRTVAQRVVEELDLQSDASFLGAEPGTDPKALADQDAVGCLLNRISVSPQKSTRILHIEARDVDPERAARLANEVAEAYVSENLFLRLKATKSATLWLEERIRELGQKAQASEFAVYEFKRDADVLSTSLENRLSIVSENLTAYSSALTEVRTQVAGLKGRMEAMEQLRSRIRRRSALGRVPDGGHGLPAGEQAARGLHRRTLRVRAHRPAPRGHASGRGGLPDAREDGRGRPAPRTRDSREDRAHAAHRGQRPRAPPGASTPPRGRPSPSTTNSSRMSNSNGTPPMTGGCTTSSSRGSRTSSSLAWSARATCASSTVPGRRTSR